MGVGAEAPPSLRRRAARPAATLLAALALLAACTKPPATGDRPAGDQLSFPTRPTLRVATRGVESIDPIKLETHEQLVVADHVFDGLVAYHPETSETLPSAAREWEVTEGGRRFVFHLRAGATFHDGSPVDAGDFAFAWNRLTDPAAAAPYSFLLQPVAGYDAYQSDVRVRALGGVRALDPTTLEVRLTTPWPDFISVLGHPALSPMPSDERSRLGPAVRPIGNGPYRIAGAIRPDQDLHLERYDDHFAGPAAIRRLVFRPFEEATDAWPEFLAADLDIAPIPASLLADAQSRYGDAGIRPLARLLYCGFRWDDPRFADRRLRRAVSLALDREEIAVGVYGGLAAPATGLVPPGLSGYDADACGALCRRDVRRARALLADVPRRDRTFALDYTESEAGAELARTIAEQLGAVGLEVTPRPHDADEYARVLEEGTQELFCLVSVADYPRQQALLEPLLSSRSEDNHAGVALAEIDQLLSEARASGAAVERIELYRRAEALALSAMPLVPLVWFRSHVAAKPYVEGFRVSPLGMFDASSLRFAAPD